MPGKPNRKLKVHYEIGGMILCMPNKSDTYLYPHLTTDKGNVTCLKCIDELQRMRNAYANFISR